MRSHAAGGGGPQISIMAFIENLPEIEAVVTELENRSSRIIELQKEAAEEIKHNFNKVMAAMRGTYMVVGGLVRVIGGGFSRIFQGMWSIAVSGIATYKAIAGALAASPVPGAQAQAILMFASLIAATANVTNLIIGQKEVARQARGINFALHGISQMLSIEGLW